MNNRFLIKWLKWSRYIAKTILDSYHDSNGRLYNWGSRLQLHCCPDQSMFQLDTVLECLIQTGSRNQQDKYVGTWWSWCGYNTSLHYSCLLQKVCNIRNRIFKYQFAFITQCNEHWDHYRIFNAAYLVMPAHYTGM